MSSRRVWVLLLAVGFVTMLLTACANSANEPSVSSPNPSQAPLQASTSALSAGQTPTGQPALESSPTLKSEDIVPAQTAAASPTLTPLSGDWRDAPIMPEISQHVIQIYQQGQAQGRDPHSFSVIGDCQAVPVVFMGPYELGTFTPPSDEGYLWDIIDYFKGSFARWGMAVRGGFTAASILTPMQADPQYCKSGETPLTCEYRVHNPAFVFITLETWLEPKTVDRYDGYLRKIMDYVVSHGSVPILLTKADSSEMRNGTHVFNPIIVQVAHDYDVPVVNFWRAAQYLDNSGIDRNREGFHLSQAGYDLKNTLALRALYKVWSLVNNSGSGKPGPAAATPTTSPTAPPQSGPMVTAPNCQGGCIFYGRAGSQDGVVKFQGVFALNYSTKDQTRIIGEGFNLQDVSQDGQRLLVNNGSNLYEVHLADGSSRLVSDVFYSLGKQGAYWNSDDSSIIFIDKNHPIQAEVGPAINLFASPLDNEIYFDGGTCTSQDFCESGGVYRQNSDGAVTPLEGILRPVFSPDGRSMAYLNPAAATNENWFHINYVLLEDPQKGISSRRIFYLPDKHKWLQYPDVREMAFSPDSQKLFILDDIYYEYTENSLRIETYMVNLQTGILYDFGKLTGTSGSFKPRLVWSPQGDKVMFFLTNLTSDNKYSLGLYQTDLTTGERLIPFDDGLLVSDEYFYITNLYWR